MRISAHLLSLLFVSFHGFCVDYYVSGNGDDNNSGFTQNAAWKIVRNVNRFAKKEGFKPGDRILFEGGCVFKDTTLSICNSGTKDHPVVFASFGEGRAHLTRQGVKHTEIIRMINCRFVEIENLEISSPDYAPQKIPRGIRIQFTSSGRYPGITVRNCYIHDICGGLWKNRHLKGGIWMRSDKNVQAGADNLLLENNRIERCHTRGIKVGGEGENVHRNVVVRGNRIDRTGQAGIVVSGGEKVLIERNTVYRAGAFYPKGDQAGVLAACWAAESRDVLIQYNEVAGTVLGNAHRPDGNLNEQSHDSQAFDIDVGAPGKHLIQYNYTHDNAGGFFLFMGKPGPEFEGAVIRYNISINDGKGFNNRLFELHSHANDNTYPVYVRNNTFCNDEAIWINNRAKNQDIHKGWEFENNIFYAPKGIFDDQTSIVYSNNLFFSMTNPPADKRALTSDPLFLRSYSYRFGFEGPHLFAIPKKHSPVKASSAKLKPIPGFPSPSKDFLGESLPAKPAVGAIEP